MAKHVGYNRHHRIAKDVGGTDGSPNVKRFKDYEHNAIHCLFGTNGPASQLVKVLEINEEVRNPIFIQAQLDLLDLFQGNYYKQECHSGDKVYKRDLGVLYTYMAK